MNKSNNGPIPICASFVDYRNRNDCVLTGTNDQTMTSTGNQ
jgi:hypothetical protein